MGRAGLIALNLESGLDRSFVVDAMAPPRTAFAAVWRIIR
jgi:hypothetical protein